MGKVLRNRVIQAVFYQGMLSNHANHLLLGDGHPPLGDDLGGGHPIAASSTASPSMTSIITIVNINEVDDGDDR